MQHTIQADHDRNNQWVTGRSSLSLRMAKMVPWRCSRPAPFAVAGDADYKWATCEDYRIVWAACREHSGVEAKPSYCCRYGGSFHDIPHDTWPDRQDKASLAIPPPPSESNAGPVPPAGLSLWQGSAPSASFINIIKPANDADLRKRFHTARVGFARTRPASPRANCDRLERQEPAPRTVLN